MRFPLIKTGYFFPNRAAIYMLRAGAVALLTFQFLLTSAVKSEAKNVTFSVTGTVAAGDQYDSSLVPGASFTALFSYALGVPNTSNSSILGYYDLGNTPYSVSAQIGDISITGGTFRQIVYNDLGSPAFDQFQFDSFGDVITSPDPSFSPLSGAQFSIAFRDSSGTLISSLDEIGSSILNNNLIGNPNITSTFQLADFPNGGYRYVYGYIDSISISEDVPEPNISSFVIIGLASGGMLKSIRRRK